MYISAPKKKSCAVGFKLIIVTEGQNLYLDPETYSTSNAKEVFSLMSLE